MISILHTTHPTHIRTQHKANTTSANTRYARPNPNSELITNPHPPQSTDHRKQSIHQAILLIITPPLIHTNISIHGRCNQPSSSSSSSTHAQEQNQHHSSAWPCVRFHVNLLRRGFPAVALLYIIRRGKCRCYTRTPETGCGISYVPAAMLLSPFS